MSYEDLLWQLQFLEPNDIWERQELIHEYCYANNIDLNKLYERPLRMYSISTSTEICCLVDAKVSASDFIFKI